ncbi:hypothetical protein [Pseudomonas mosselii]|uniref:hypothetical protein n=1 Tax=Pseudomonas mosselii TaxID=78327 RepID=UPI000BB45C84|nr:hypothetical protein [Pseudomonas mosselii]ATB63308.1 hypothetical protein CLJ08_01155 [Pseudomonas mosselii]
MNYENRLICFFDLLGFSAAIKQAEREPELAKRLFEIFSEFKNGGLETALYGEIPFLDVDGMKTCRDYYGEALMEHADQTYRLVATQFSDSFVISAPADNHAACDLLLRAVQIIHFQFFVNLGMLMRGGMAVGNVVHERGGALFGPAMIEAYELESKHAVYARVVLSQDAALFIDKLLSHSQLKSAFFRGFDGFEVFDLISALQASPRFKGERSWVEQRLKDVEDDVLRNAPAAHPKIAYLLDRWRNSRQYFSDSAAVQPSSEKTDEADR